MNSENADLNPFIESQNESLPQEELEKLVSEMQDLAFPHFFDGEAAEPSYASMAEGLERNLVKKFKMLRERREWSQAIMCKHLKKFGLDIHQTTLAKIEAGKRPLRVSEAHIFAFAFEMPLNVVYQLDITETGGSWTEYGLKYLEEQVADEIDYAEKYKATMMETLEGLVDGLAETKARILHFSRVQNELAQEKAEAVRHDSE